VQVIIDGVTYEVPHENDWEFGELEVLARERDLFGDIGATVATIWLVKHRLDVTFTIEQARKVKLGQVREVEAPDEAADPSVGVEPPESEPNSGDTGSSSSGAPDPSGTPLSSGSTD
jgi:hypothetical protein